MIGRVWAIALNMFREAARIKVLYGILVLVLGANLLAVRGYTAPEVSANCASSLALLPVLLPQGWSPIRTTPSPSMLNVRSSSGCDSHMLAPLKPD